MIWLDRLTLLGCALLVALAIAGAIWVQLLLSEPPALVVVHGACR